MAERDKDRQRLNALWNKVIAAKKAAKAPRPSQVEADSNAVARERVIQARATGQPVAKKDSLRMEMLGKGELVRDQASIDYAAARRQTLAKLKDRYDRGEKLTAKETETLRNENYLDRPAKPEKPKTAAEILREKEAALELRFLEGTATAADSAAARSQAALKRLQGSGAGKETVPTRRSPTDVATQKAQRATADLAKAADYEKNDPDADPQVMAAMKSRAMKDLDTARIAQKMPSVLGEDVTFEDGIDMLREWETDIDAFRKDVDMYMKSGLSQRDAREVAAANFRQNNQGLTIEYIVTKVKALKGK